MSLPRMVAALGVGLFCLSSHPPALAAGPDELEQVKSQLAELRQSYDARLQALEKRIAELQQAVVLLMVQRAPRSTLLPYAPLSRGQPGAANAPSSVCRFTAGTLYPVCPFGVTR